MKFLIALFVCTQVYLIYGQQCPQGTCSSDQTCCPGPIPGLYGCCPAPNAVCCSDGEHCCPQDTVCNLAQGTCDSSVDGKVVTPMVLKPKDDNEVGVVYCPDGTSFCQDSNTCCLLAQGVYGCCPYPSATCCSDGAHCCPQGTRCDATSQYCLQAGNPLFRVAPKRPRPATRRP